MHVKCLIQKGSLDISSQEQLHGEETVFRLALRPGQIVFIPDQYRGLKNIDSAINAGLLEVLNYDKRDGSIVVNAELKKPYTDISLNDLKDVEAPSPTNLQALVFDTASGSWIPGEGGGGGLVSVYSLLEFNREPLENPNGVLKTFTIPDNHIFVSEKINVYVNGQLIDVNDYEESGLRQSIQFKSHFPAPAYGDLVRFHYLRESSSVSPEYLLTMNESVDGDIDGVNKTFYLIDDKQYVESKIEVSINGNVVSYEDYDQSIDYKSFTFKPSVPAPQPGDIVEINYLRLLNPYEVLFFNDLPVEIPNGVNKTFTLQNNVSYSYRKISVTINGQRISKNDFSESLDFKSITFGVNIPAPQLGDIVSFYYLKG